VLLGDELLDVVEDGGVGGHRPMIRRDPRRATA
jgi:hypothetical protein